MLTRGLLLVALFAWSLVALAEGYPGLKAVPAGDFDAALDVVGGARRIFCDGVDRPTLKVGAWSVDGAEHEVSVQFQIADIFGNPLTSRDDFKILLPADGARAEKTILFQPGLGYFSINAQFKSGNTELSRWVDLGIVYPPFAGPRPNSLFGSNTSGLKEGVDLDFLQKIGMKVERVHFTPPVQAQHPYWPLEFPRGEAVALDFSKLDRNWELTKAHDIWALPIVGYSLAGAGNIDRTALARKLGMYGPPGDGRRFISTWETILRHYPEITTYEFWNEPWIFEWTWAATPSDYRQLQKDWCAMALRVNPHLAILAGSSTMFIRDNIEPYPECWRGLLSGVTHHPYTRSVSEESFRGGDNQRSIDDCVLTARQMGLERAFLTEGGTNFQSGRPWEKEKFNNLENASKIVQYYVTAALCGAFMGNAQWGIGYGPDWTRSNTAFAVMTHFLEDRVPLVDLWPKEELLWGAIFAESKFATDAVKALTRASELQPRWAVEVPARSSSKEDTTKVAVLWSLTGQSKTKLDKAGELVISDPSGLRAFDLTGREILPVQGELVLPFTGVPVYITTENLSVIDFRNRIIGGTIRGVTPLNLYALSLSGEASEKQLLSVRIQNQLNRPLEGTLTLRVGQASEQTSAGFRVEAGSLAEVPIEWPGVASNLENRYPVTLNARLEPASSGLSPVARDQVIAVAKFAKRTLELTGSPNDIKGLTPVVMDSQNFEDAPDPTRHLLNPALEHSAGAAGLARVIARVATAYDEANVYITAVVKEDKFHSQAGQPATVGQKGKEFTLPYKQGMPDGLHYITYCGNVLEFSFGFRDRVPGLGRQISDPWAWKGSFYDTDYSFVAHASTQGDQLIRIWGPEGQRQDGYQTEAVPGMRPVPGGKVKITRDESQKLSIYEIAIPRHELALFDPGRGRCRFGFILYNSEGATGGSLNWSEGAGVFDFWQSAGSFPPTWNQRLACQTFFAIEQ